MTVTAAPRRPSVAARRFGYLVAIALQAVLLYLLNVRPGWQVLPFLSPDMRDVIGLLNASIGVGIGVNVLYLVSDPPWLRAAGDVVTSAVGMAVLVRLWQVFPFDFSGTSFDWALVARVLIVVGIVGSAIGIVAALVRWVRGGPKSAGA